MRLHRRLIYTYYLPCNLRGVSSRQATQNSRACARPQRVGRKSEGLESSMIRILQQDTRAVKILFAVIIGLAAVTMVITLVPGVFDNSTSSNNAAIYATVHRPGILGRLGLDTEQVKTVDVNQLAGRQLQQQR